VVAGLRKKLDLNPANGLDSSNQVLILSALRSGMLRSRKLAEIWMKAISSASSPSELGPLDIAVVLLLYSFIPGPKTQIHYVLRNRIKAGVITEALIEKTFNLFLAVCIFTFIRTSTVWMPCIILSVAVWSGSHISVTCDCDFQKANKSGI
jgi:hypothetical protein